MAKRLGIPMRRLREFCPGACETDARILVKDGDEHNVSMLMHEAHIPLRFSSTREMRLLAKQLEYVADYFDHSGPAFEEVNDV